MRGIYVIWIQTCLYEQSSISFDGIHKCLLSLSDARQGGYRRFAVAGLVSAASKAVLKALGRTQGIAALSYFHI